MMKALIDGDVLRYQCGFPADGEPVENALYNTKKLIKEILGSVGADDYRIYLTGKGNFRYDVATIKPYKGTRSGDKPEHYDAITDYLINVWKAEVVEGIEADDAMSIEQCKLFEVKEEGTYGRSVICTIDKDLDMVPGNHYNWNTDDKYWCDTYGGLELDDTKSKPKCVGAGIMFFWAQMLMGDTVDNIPGVPRVGPVKAYNLLKDCQTEDELFCIVGQQYAYKYDDPEAAMLENGRLLWMLQKEDTMWEIPE